MKLPRFRFSVGLEGANRSEIFEHARMAEDLGYSGLAITDHVSMPRLSPIAAMAALAALDSNLRLTSTVLGNDFRHPALLASEAATIDLISGGRLELGIGTGWWGPDYDQTGIPFDPPGVRVNRLIEAVTVIKGLFSGQPFSFDGQHYTIRNLELNPKPIQDPHPPIVIGGGGKRMLSLAGREADIVSINPLTKNGSMDFSTANADVFAEKVAWVREAAGNRFNELELNCHIFTLVIADDAKVAAEQWRKQMAEGFGLTIDLSVEELLASPHVLIGSTEELVDRLQARRQQFGVAYFNIPGPLVEPFAPVVARLAGS